MNRYKSIAIDGPSGAGKSTLAKMLAEKLEYLYVDTGAIYRTVGLCVFRKDLVPTDVEHVTELLQTMHIDMRYGGDGLQHMFLDGEDVTEAIRQHEISRYASLVSAIPAVRAYLLDRQREMARSHNVIMDGRDIGTVVLPDADVKLFLTASAEDRAMRRYQELIQRGQNTDFAVVLRDIRERDEQDSHRAAAPLKKAEDAILIDTTGNSLEESFRILFDTVKERLQA